MSNINLDTLQLAAYIGSFVFFCTTLGSGFVFFFKNSTKPIYIQASMGFSAGIMIAASIFSLIIPALDASPFEGNLKCVPVMIGFTLGALFLIAIDKSLPHLHLNSKVPEGPKSRLRRHVLLFLALTIHNIPEGMALGVSAAATNLHTSTIASTCVLALGIGIQNMPEGAAISLPFFAFVVSRFKAFILGSMSGIVEPIAAILVVVLSDILSPLLPWFLAFAAGAMLYVVVEELIPQSHSRYDNDEEPHSDVGTVSVLIGFLLMMFLDTTLGA